jgi:rod shape-determining protein MreC
MNKRRVYYIIFLIATIIVAHYIGILRPVENVVFGSLEKPFSSGFFAGKNFFGFFSQLKESFKKQEEDESKNERIIALEQEILSLKDILRQKQILDEHLEFLKKNSLKSVLAKVISRGFENSPGIILINVGKKDGVKEGMAVLGDQGIVIGKISSVEDSFSQVLFLSYFGSQISVSDANGKTLGIAEGGKDFLFKLNYILKESEIKIGDLVLTSDEEGIIPRGLLVGSIGQIFEDEREIFKSARLDQMINLNKQYIVDVVLR